MSRRLSFALGALLLAGCITTTTRGLEQDATERVGSSSFELRWARGDDRAAQQVRAALSQAVARLEPWGGLRTEVSVDVLPTHDALEASIGRTGAVWLRAWARYDTVLVQSPRTWGLFGAEQAQVDELVAHELVHCAMYQRLGSPSSWSRNPVPLWFREGMASVVSEQGYRRGTLEGLAERAGQPGADLLGRQDGTYWSDSQQVYSAAHHAFAFLLQRYGRPRVLQVLDVMREGASFEQAFESTLGLPVLRFERDFLAYVRLRGFAGRPLLPPPPQLVVPPRVAPGEPVPPPPPPR